MQIYYHYFKELTRFGEQIHSARVHHFDQTAIADCNPNRIEAGACEEDMDLIELTRN